MNGLEQLTAERREFLADAGLDVRIAVGGAELQDLGLGSCGLGLGGIIVGRREYIEM